MATVRAGGVEVEFLQEGSGPDLVLLHSLLTELTVFDEVAPRLARSRRVTRINLPGFGASGALALETVGAHADHVADVMNALGLAASADVFGNGFGAFVALELAIRHWSNANIRRPNRGQDFATLALVF